MPGLASEILQQAISHVPQVAVTLLKHLASMAAPKIHRSWRLCSHSELHHPLRLRLQLPAFGAAQIAGQGRLALHLHHMHCR